MKKLTSPLLLLVFLTYSFTSCKKEKEVVVEIKIVRDTVKVIDTLDVDRPINFIVSKGQFGSKMTLQWEQMPLATKYQVWRFDADKNIYSYLKDATTNTYEDTSFDKTLTKVFYKVRAVNSKGIFSRFSDADYGYLSATTYNFVSSFGSEGTGAAQFTYPKYVEVDKLRNIYVSDDGANRVTKFDPSGNYVSLFYSGSGARAMGFFSNGDYICTRTQSSSYVQVFSSIGSLLYQWGTYGTGNDNFGNIEQIAIDNDDNIWIVDGINDRVKKYTKTGTLLLILGKTGTGNGEFTTPLGICFHNENIYVTDVGNSNVQVFDKAGKYLRTWKTKRVYQAIKSDGKQLFVTTPSLLIRSDENGEVQEEIGQGRFSYLMGVAVRSENEVLLTDYYARKIFVFKKI